jgi:DNA/RNA endonuclease YhcR with UshA esterase domain
MKKFLADNKIIILIAIVGFLSGAVIYLFQNQKQPGQNLAVEENLRSDEVVSSVQLKASSQEKEEEEKESEFVIGCASYINAGNYIGKEQCITGKVDNVHVSSGGTVFLNFCADYKVCPFSAVIFKSDVPKFLDPKQYQGKTVEITGLVKTYQGRPEIILNDASQIKIK